MDKYEGAITKPPQGVKLPFLYHTTMGLKYRLI